MGKNNSLRGEFKNLRDSLSYNSKQQYSNMVSQNLIALLNSEFKGAKIFLAFYPLENEIDLRSFYDYLLKKGIDLYFPVSKPIDKSLTFYQINNLKHDFKCGTYNVMEPIDRTNPINSFENVFCITPGLVFDMNFNRVGYGAGYYDRFFAEHPSILKIGVSFDCQLIDALSPKSHDVKMDYIVTENSCLKRR